MALIASGPHYVASRQLMPKIFPISTENFIEGHEYAGLAFDLLDSAPAPEGRFTLYATADERLMAILPDNSIVEMAQTDTDQVEGIEVAMADMELLSGQSLVLSERTIANYPQEIVGKLILFGNDNGQLLLRHQDGTLNELVQTD